MVAHFKPELPNTNFKNFILGLWINILHNREENIVSLRALDSYLKEKLSTWLSPAALELHQITWDDPASLLEKIVAYEVFYYVPCQAFWCKCLMWTVF